MTTPKEYDVVQEADEDLGSVSKVYLGAQSQFKIFADFQFCIYGFSFDRARNMMYIIRSTKITPWGDCLEWFTPIYLSDCDSANDLYKKMSQNKNASIEKKFFSSGQINMYLKNKARDYNKKIRDGSGQECILVTKPDVFYVDSAHGEILILSDTTVLPLSKDIDLQILAKIRILWIGEEAEKRYIKLGLSDQETRDISAKYFRLIKEYYGENFGSFLLLLGSIYMHSVHAFLGDDFPLHCICLYGTLCTGMNTISLLLGYRFEQFIIFCKLFRFQAKQP